MANEPSSVHAVEASLPEHLPCIVPFTTGSALPELNQKEPGLLTDFTLRIKKITCNMHEVMIAARTLISKTCSVTEINNENRKAFSGLIV